MCMPNSNRLTQTDQWYFRLVNHQLVDAAGRLPQLRTGSSLDPKRQLDWEQFQHVSTCVIQVSKWSLIAEQSGHLDPARVWYGDDMVMIWCKLILTHCDAVMTHCGPVVYQSLPNHCRAKWRARWLLGGRWNLTSPSEGREARFKWFTFELLKLWAKLQR